MCKELTEIFSGFPALPDIYAEICLEGFQRYGVEGFHCFQRYVQINRDVFRGLPEICVGAFQRYF